MLFSFLNILANDFLPVIRALVALRVVIEFGGQIRFFMQNRINVLIVVAMVVFIAAAKFLTPYESTINEYGFWLVGIIILFLCGLTFSIEFLILKAYVKFKNKGS